MREKLKEAAMKYRLLKVGDTISIGDHQRYKTGDWTVIGCGNYSIGDDPTEYSDWIFRRPIPSTSCTSTNSRLRKCPHCGKSLRRALPKSADVV
jgi:hypothetical protein